MSRLSMNQTQRFLIFFRKTDVDQRPDVRAQIAINHIYHRSLETINVFLIHHLQIALDSENLSIVRDSDEQRPPVAVEESSNGLRDLLVQDLRWDALLVHVVLERSLVFDVLRLSCSEKVIYRCIS